MFSEDLLHILACPLCKEDVRLEDDRIVCPRCGRRYPIRDGIPIMIVEEAEAPEGTVPPDEFSGTPDQETG